MCRRLICMASSVLVLIAAGTASADLVGHWTLDEGSGDTATDSSGNGNDGTIVDNPVWDIAWITGPSGGAVEFYGVGTPAGNGDYFDCGSDASLHFTGPFSIALWVRPGADDPEGQATTTAPIAKAMDPDWSWQVRYGWGSTEPFMGFQFNATPRTWVYVGQNLERDEWCHLACSYDSTTVKCYLNGEETDSAAMSALVGQSSPVLIGSDGWGCDWIGGIDDVRMYDHALSEPEILATMEGEISPQAWGPSPKDGELLPQIWANLSWKPGPFAVSHDVYIGDNSDDVDSGAADTFIGNQGGTDLVVGFATFPIPDGLVPGTTYFWRIDEVNDADPNSPWKGDIWSFSIPPKTAYSPDPPDGAEFVDPDATLSWTGGFDAKMHTVYIGDNYDEVANATAGASVGVPSYDPPGTLEPEKVLYWRVDEFDGFDTFKGDVWAFTTPGAVGSPQPANGAADVRMTATLSWTAADNAASHELYFGTDADAVKAATTASPEYVGPKALGAVSYDPGKLAWDAEYAWRVDEVYPTGTIKGLVWSFETADFILVDDFESYNDSDPPEPNSNIIFNAWIDGFGTTTNGALVGNDMPPYAETTIVHSGDQSMIYSYDNAGKTSEATLTLVYPRDWTEEGVTELSLWFRGNSANSTERMYVALNGNAVVYHDDPAATQLGGWREWVIDLQAFGINLANVNTITIGFGTKNAPAAGGPGTMYFDDIRLYRPGISDVSPITITVPNGDFEEIYKPGSDTITADLGGGWTQGLGPDGPMDDGTATYSDGTTGDAVDIPGWIGADPQGWIDGGGTYGRDTNFPNRQGSVARQSDTPDGLYYYLSNGGGWGNAAGGLIVSDASLGNVEGGTYTLSMVANGGATPVVLELLADGVALTPSSSVDPVLSDEWQEFSRTYDAASLGGHLGESLTIRLGVGRGASGGQSHFDAVSLSYAP